MSFNMEEEILKYKQSLNYKREAGNGKSNDYEFYYPENFTTDPREIYEMYDKIEKEKELDENREKWAMGEKDPQAISFVKVSVNTEQFTNDLKSWDNDTVKEEARERTLSGKSIDMAIGTLKNFNVDEIEAKMEVIQTFSNRAITIERFNLLRNDDMVNDMIKRLGENFPLKEFFDNYEILEKPYVDKKTGMSALVIGNRKTKNVEIIFGASQDPTSIFKQDEDGEMGRKDWIGNNARSPIMTPDSQKAALEFALKIKEKYEEEHNGYKTLTTVNGHSKGGGEAIYAASHANLKCFIIDPAPVVNPGKYINNYKFLAMVPNMGNATLTGTERVEGTDFYTLKFKPAIKHGHGEIKVSNILAIPVEHRIEVKDNNEVKKYHHYTDNKLAVRRLGELKRYAKEIEPKFRAVYKNGKYIDKKDPKVRVR